MRPASGAPPNTAWNRTTYRELRSFEDRDLARGVRDLPARSALPARARSDSEDALGLAQSAAAVDRLSGYWIIGARLRKEKIEKQAGYHNSLLRDLSADSGLSIRTLQESVAFSRAYSKVPSGKGLLPWSHYRLLARIDSEEERQFYEALVREKKLSAAELTRALAAGLFEGGKLEAPKMERPTDSSFLYVARALEIVDADTFDLDIDLGFYCWTKQRMRLARVDASEFGSAEARAARNFAVEQLATTKTLVVKSLTTDVHGRFVVHLFYSRAEVSPLECFVSGAHFNDVLLRKEFAVLVA